MQDHTKIYLNSFGYDTGDFIRSELSLQKSEDIHHISCRGSGGDPEGKKDRIENIIALTRDEHEKYGDKKEFMAMLYQKHMDFMIRRNVKFDYQYILDLIEKYSEVEQSGQLV